MSTPSPAAWHPDPTQRHRLRYFDGTNWTDNVMTHAGVQARDPLQAAPPVQQPQQFQPAPQPQQYQPAPQQFQPQQFQPGPPQAPLGWTPPPSTPISQMMPAATVAGPSKSPANMVLALIAAAAAVVGVIASVSLDWITAKGDFGGSGTVSISLKRSRLSDALDAGVDIGGLWKTFIKWAWVLSPAVCVLAALLALGYISSARTLTIVLAAITTAMAVGTALALRTTAEGEVDSPAIGVFLVAGAALVALIVAIAARKRPSTA